MISLFYTNTLTLKIPMKLSQKWIVKWIQIIKKIMPDDLHISILYPVKSKFSLCKGPRRSLMSFIIKGFRNNSHLYCYFHNVSGGMSSGLVQIFVEHGNLHGTSNFIESTGVACSDSVCHNKS